MPASPDDECPDIIPLPPLTWDDLPKFEPIGQSGAIVRRTMTVAEFRERFPDHPIPKDASER